MAKDIDEKPKADKPAEDGLVKMQKSGERPLYVHPSCVKDHEKAGWLQS